MCWPSKRVRFLIANDRIPTAGPFLCVLYLLWEYNENNSFHSCGAEALLRMLHFNAKGHVSIANDPEAYKVLILDDVTKNIVAPILRVDELRSHGITLHMQLQSDRQPIPDVSAIYFVSPTEANVARVADDAKNGLYDSIYLNFSSQIGHEMLEKFAGMLVEGNAAARVSQVYDQHTNFVSLEPGLFSLGLSKVYLELNDPQTKDNMIENCINTVVDGIFNMLVTCGVVPYISSPPGGAAEHIARLLDSKLRGILQERSNVFNENIGVGLTASLQRPLLCLFDRNFELSVAVQHAWTYKPLVHDTMGLRLNRTTGSPYLNGKLYDLDARDHFWERHGNEQFPKIAEEVEAELKQYKEQVEELNKSTGANIDPNAIDPSDAMSNSTKGLKSALTTLPQLTEKKKNIDKHTNLATGLLQVIKERKLDHFYSLEEDLISGKSGLSEVTERLNSPEGTPLDKLRLALVWLLTTTPAPSDADCQSIENALQTCKADIAAWMYVKRMRRMNLAGKSTSQTTESSALGGSGAQFAADFLGSTFGQGLTSLTKGVKTLLAGEQQAAVTVAVESLMDGKLTQETEGYLMLDPKSSAGGKRPQQAFKEAIVFIIGGGNYLEWGSLSSWAARAQPLAKSIVYGATDILNGEDMVQQLAELGRHS